MTEFILIFRHPGLQDLNISPEEMQAMMQRWDNWFGGIAAQGKFVQGNRLGEEGKVLKSAGVITDGPFAEIKERLGGFIIVRAENLDEATTLAHGCPILDGDGTVEIRPVMSSQ